MKLTLTKHGGLAALKFRPKTIDAANLPPDQAAELARLVAATKHAPPPDREASERVRDAMTYEIAITDGTDTLTLKQSDGAMTPAFSALLDWINRQPAG